MKLSHVLIAALVTTSLVASAQNDKPKKGKRTAKVENLATVKPTKNKTERLNCVKPVDVKLTEVKTEKYCPACGRG